ncbi:hypothetical protein ASG04_08725 [Curtobacterium sp. Leaf183]|nr:hypothetical protein ASG04_08725 [Curtobacterium sp. Leaf183]
MSSNTPGAWTRRVGPQAARTRTTVIRVRNSAGGLLAIYVAALLVVFGLQGFRSTGERWWPNVLLFGSMLLVICCEVVLTIQQQRSMRLLRQQVSAVLTRGTDEKRSVIRDDALLDIDRFDAWTGRFGLRWFDGTVHAPVNQQSRLDR